MNFDSSNDIFVMVQIARELHDGDLDHAKLLSESLVSNRNMQIVRGLFYRDEDWWIMDRETKIAVTFVRVIAGVGTWDELQE